MLRDELRLDYISPFYEYIHVLCYNQFGFLRDWLHFTSPDTDDDLHAEGAEQRALEETERQATVSASDIARIIHEYIRQRVQDGNDDLSDSLTNHPELRLSAEDRDEF